MATELTTYKYEARHQATGKAVSGKTKARDEETVSNGLFEAGYIPLNIQAETRLNKDLSFGTKRAKPKNIAATLRQLATLVNAGIPLSRSLEIIRDQEETPALKNALTQIRKDIDTGLTLGAAMTKHENVFTNLTLSMVRAGEQGGFLNETLDNVATNLEAEVKLAQKIKSAMVYPIVILALTVLMVGAMLIFIVPVFQEMFSSLGGELPIPTQILVDLSDFLKNFGIPLAIGVGIFIFWWKRNKDKPHIRRRMDPIRLKLPIFGKLNQKIVLARFTRNFGSLLSAGLPVLQVMDIVGPTSGSTVLEDALVDIRKAVLQGEPLAKQFSHPIFPRMIREMIAVGEDAGEIPQMMEKTAKTYDDDVNATTDALASLLEPLMIVVLGVVVGGMIVALYMPIFTIYEHIQ